MHSGSHQGGAVSFQSEFLAGAADVLESGLFKV